MTLLTEFWRLLTHPAENWPVLSLIGVFFGMVIFSSAIAIVAWRAVHTWGRLRPRLNLTFALSAAILSFLGLTTLTAEFYMETDGVKHSINLKWFFILPALLSVVAIRSWLVNRRRFGAAPVDRLPDDPEWDQTERRMVAHNNENQPPFEE